jgi:hypothetical protein
MSPPQPDTRSDALWLVRNQTPRRLRIQRADGPVELAPLQTLRIGNDPSGWGDGARDAQAARALVWEQEPARNTRERDATNATLLVGLLLCTAFLAGAAGWEALSGLAILILPPALVWLVSLYVRAKPDRGRFLADVAVRVLQTLAGVLVVAVGVGVPLAATFYGTEVFELWQAYKAGIADEDQAFVANLATGRVAQLVLVGILALLPALLYFQFDRERVETLLDRWLHHIFRFDPTLTTLDDVDARYGRRLEEVYGASVTTSSGQARQRSRSHSPVVVATALLALGWVLVLITRQSDGEFDVQSTSALFVVERSPISFAFLGAYLYGLNVVLRGYVRGDLRPKTYAGISVRVVLSFVLAWAVDGLLRGDYRPELVLGLAFLAGVVPDTVLRYLRDAVESAWYARQGRLRRKRRSLDELADRWPLTDLEGIDLYERTRLGEEGITNVQALAHHDVVDLTLATRIPFERVVHWVDQAVLYEHVTGGDRKALRRYGVLTATGLAAAARAGDATVRRVLDNGRLDTVLAALSRADWFPQLQAWRDARTEERAELLTFPSAPVPEPRGRRVVLPEPARAG